MIKRFFTAVVILLACLTSAYSQGDGVPDVAYLSHMNDVIVVGIGSVESQIGSASVINIVVKRVIKGNGVPSVLNIPLQTESPMCTVDKAAPPVSAIWFLRQAPSGQLSFGPTPKSQSCHPMKTDYQVPEGNLESRWSYGDDRPPRDKLAYELAASVYSSNGAEPSVFNLNRLLLETASESTQEDIDRKLSNSSDMDVAMIGKLGLMSHGDLSEIKALSSDFSNLSKMTLPSKFGDKNGLSSASSPPTTYESLIARHLGSVKSTDPAVVEQMGNLLQTASSSQAVRVSVARSLRNIHTALAVTYLAPLMWDKDTEVQAEAVAGLACFANNMPVIDYKNQNGIGIDLNLQGPYKSADTVSHFTMGTQTFSKNGNYYLAFWKQWWSTNGASVTVAAMADRNAPVL